MKIGTLSQHRPILFSVPTIAFQTDWIQEYPNVDTRITYNDHLQSRDLFFQ